MADYFDAATKNNDDTKAALLASIAQNGSQAKAAFDQAQAQIQAQKLQAVAAAVAEAAQRGAPQATQDQTTGTVSSGYDRRLADLSSARASREGSLASISAQGGTYLDEANAAIPGLRARQTMANTTAASSLANRLATLKANQDMATQTQNRQATEFEQTLADRKAQRDAAAAAAQQAAIDKANQQAQQKQLDDIQLAIANANLGKAQTSADQQAAKQAKPAKEPKAPTVAQLIAANFGNQQGFSDYVNQATPQVNAAGKASSQQDIADSRRLGSQGNLAARSDANTAPLYTPATNADVAERVGSALGFAPGVASSLIQPAANKATAAAAKQFNADNPDLVSIGKNVGLSTKGVQDMMNTTEYKKAVQLAEAIAGNGGSVDQLKAALGKATELNNKPKTRQAILFQYGRQLVSPTYVP